MESNYPLQGLPVASARYRSPTRPDPIKMTPIKTPPEYGCVDWYPYSSGPGARTDWYDYDSGLAVPAV
jgi:hypothetical protein